jgi:hypothetical protein
VTIRCGDAINSIAFTYTNRAGQKRTAGPWGGDGPLTATVSDFSYTFILFHFILYYYTIFACCPNRYLCAIPDIQDKIRYFPQLKEQYN